MFKLLRDVADLAGDTVKVVTAPVRVVVNATSQVVKPIAEALDEAADDLKDDR